MRAAPITLVVALTGTLAVTSLPAVRAQSPVTAPTAVAKTPAAVTTATSPLYQRFLSPASPLELAAAKKVDRMAWVAFEEGKRNAYTAVAPAFTPVAAHELPERRRHRHVGDPDLGRRSTVVLRAGDGAESRRLGRQSVGGSERARARRLGRAHRRRTGLPGRGSAERRLPSSRPTAAPSCS